MPNVMRVLMLDNVDSFTYNLVDEFAKRDTIVTVLRHDRSAAEVINAALAHQLVVVSPGPGTPEEAGCARTVLTHVLGTVPIFGVCLGHQALVIACGGRVGRATVPVQGRAIPLVHTGAPPFEGLPNPMAVGRYHSLIATEIPNELEITANAAGEVMAVRHRTAPALGVQFHPESVLTPDGGRMIENVIQWASHVRR